MQKKDISYHSSAVKYNEGLAEAAERLAEEVENDEVKKWCKSVGKQHRFHAKRHAAALAKLENAKAKPEKAEKNDHPEDNESTIEAGAEEKHEVNA